MSRTVFREESRMEIQSVATNTLPLLEEFWGVESEEDASHRQGRAADERVNAWQKAQLKTVYRRVKQLARLAHDAGGE